MRNWRVRRPGATGDNCRPKGIGVFGNWYSQMLQGAYKRIKNAVFSTGNNTTLGMERMLCDEGTLIFALVSPVQADMKARLKALLQDDPLHSWRISPLDWQQSKTYDKFGALVTYSGRTSRDYAPWYVVEGVDEYYRSLTVRRILLDGLQAALRAESRPLPHPSFGTMTSSLGSTGCWIGLDMARSWTKGHVLEQLITEQARLSS